MKEKLKELLKSSKTLKSTIRHIRKVTKNKSNSKINYSFNRISLENLEGITSRSIHQIRNLLNYTKVSGSSYSAKQYPAGYHTIQINGEYLQGQRNPEQRINIVPINFEGKTILDIGSNQGGMLFQLEKKIKWGIGIDYDSRMINAANRIKALREAFNLNFYVFDLQNEPLELIEDFLPESKVDIVFLLSVCMWLKNWEQVIDFAANISESMLFESNGNQKQQDEQIRKIKSIYRDVIQLTENSEDDVKQKNRKLFYCSNPIKY